MVSEIAQIIMSAASGEIANEIRQRFEQSGSDEEAWESGCYELAVKLRASFERYRAGDSYDDSQFKRELDRFGIGARELAVIGDEKGYNQELNQTIEELSEACTKLADTHVGIGNTLEPAFTKENIPSLIEHIVEIVED